MSDLPEGWVTTPLATIADLVRGVTYSKKDAISSPKAGYLPILRATNINGHLSLDSEMVYVPAHYVRSVQQMRMGDIVVAASSGSLSVVGKSAQLRQAWKGGFGAFCSVIRPDPNLAPSYLAHLVTSPWIRTTWRGLAKGTNINNLKSSDLASTPIPLPSFKEQERIVTALEEHFSRLDTGVATLERAFHNLRRLKAAVLEAAVTGRLIVDAPLDDGIPDSWAWKPLEAIITRLRNGVFVSRPGMEPNERPILRISAVRPMALNTTDVRYVPASAKIDASSFILEGGDLLFTRYSGNPEYVGACASVPPLNTELLYPDKLIRVQVDRAVIEPRFVEIAASAGQTRRTIRSRVKTTAGQTGISGRDLKSVPFPVPPLNTQRRIIRAVESAMTRIGRLEEELTLGMKRSTSLRSTILAAAFSGKLVSQDPTDEPASALLERIAAERASSNDNKSARAPSQRHKKAAT